MRNIHYINAGAGSGKTYTLTEKLTEKIISGACKPSEVILTTFTELAAGEFRERAQAKLIENKLFDDAAELQNSMIGTVHSVAHKFVAKYWYLLGRGVQTNVMAEGDKNFYINQSLAGIAGSQEISFFNDFRQEFDLKVGKPAKPDYDFWQDHLKKIVDSIDAYNIGDQDVSVEKSKEVARLIFNGTAEVEKDRIGDFLRSYKSYCSGYTTKEAQKTIVKIESIAAARLCYASLARIAKLLEKPIGGQKAFTLIPDLDEMHAYVQSLMRSRTYADIICRYIDTIFGLANKWRTEFKEYKRRNRLIDFNDMELLFLQLLDNEIVQADIRNNFKLVLVDEFQDSNPTQLKIFDKLSELVAESIWVGDPKQAIYGFRGSDAELISAITSVFPRSQEKNELGLSSETLGTSWRSGNELVEHTNKVFVPAFADTLSEAQVRLKPHRPAKEFGNTSTLHHWHISEENKGGYYKTLAQNISKLLNQEHGIKQVFCKESKQIRDLRPEDIVILTRKNLDREVIIKELREVGIKVSAPENDFANKAEVRLAESLLNYVLNPTNDLAKAEIIYLMNDKSIEEIVENRLTFLEDYSREKPQWLAEDNMFAEIDRVSRRIKEQSVSSLVESLILELDLPGVIKKWGDYENRRANIDALLKMAKQYEDRCLQLGLGASLDGFLAYLPQMMPDSSESRFPGMVSVLTYHKSKGLEWNVVILDSLYGDELDEKELIQKSFFGVQTILTSEPTKENLYPERYISLIPWFLSSTKSKLPTTISADIVESEMYKTIHKRQMNECKRLLYVGLTRARDYVITTSYQSSKTCELHWIRNIGMSGYHLPGNQQGGLINVWGCGDKSDYLNLSVDEGFVPQNMATTYAKIIRQPANECHKPKYISPSSLVADSNSGEVNIIQDFEYRIPLQNASDKITAVGTCLHNIFCACPPSRPDSLKIARETIKNHSLDGVIPDETAVIRAIQNLYDYLTAQYGAAVNIYREYPFMNAGNGQIVRGSIDMVWETERGCVIVDYKSFPGTKEAITNPTNSHYAGNYAAQLREYAMVVALTGKKTLDTLVYYSVQGCVARLQYVIKH